MPLLFAGLSLGLPISASAGACDHIDGVYAGARIGELGYNRELLAFDRVELTDGAGKGRQVQVATATAQAGSQIDLVISCTSIDATHARLDVQTQLVGSGTGFSCCASVTVTVYAGGSRLWIVGNNPPNSMQGWLLRVPPPP
ncbi:MAG TPA: hypothetical protein VF006_06065 [Longimicrobium sp.]